MGRIVEGVWDCASCDTKGIRASLKNCPHCGGLQTTYYLPEQITYVSEEEKKNITNAPDWVCSYCETLNRDDNNICSNCGASKISSEMNYLKRKEILLQNKKERLEEEESLEDGEQNTDNGMVGVDGVDIPVVPEKKAKSSTFNEYDWLREKGLNRNGTVKTGTTWLGCLLLILVAFIISGFFIKIPHNETITGFRWERSAFVEEYKTLQESDWSLPTGGRLIKTKDEVHHYEQVVDHYETERIQKSKQVLDHYEDKEVRKERQVIDHYEEVVTGYKDMGNGYYEEQTSREPVYKTEVYYEMVSEPVYRTETYFEEVQKPVYRDEPVYKTKYYYEIDRWVVVRSLDTSGSDKEPYFGTTALKDNQRITNGREVYYIDTVDKKEESHSYVVNYDIWNKYNANDKVKFYTNIYGMVDEDSFVGERN